MIGRHSCNYRGRLPGYAADDDSRYHVALPDTRASVSGWGQTCAHARRPPVSRRLLRCRDAVSTAPATPADERCQHVVYRYEQQVGLSSFFFIQNTDCLRRVGWMVRCIGIRGLERMTTYCRPCRIRCGKVSLALSYLVSSLQVLSRPCRHDAGSRGGGQGIGLLYVITVARSLHISYFPGTTSGIVELLH